MRRGTRFDPRAALTLIEITVASALLVVFLAGLFAALGAARRAELFAREHQIALEAATRQLDLQTSTEFSELLTVLGDDTSSTGVQIVSEPLTVGFATSQVALRGAHGDGDDNALRAYVKVVPNQPYEGFDDYDGDDVRDMVLIQVVVKWVSFDGSELELQLQRVRSRG